MNKAFKKTGGIRPGKSAFDLSFEHKTTCNMGELIPIAIKEALPGDVFSIGNEIVIRMQPMVAPILHPINVSVHWWNVPNRIMWHDNLPSAGNWEDYVTGGPDGTTAPTLPVQNGPYTSKQLADYLGFPLGVALDGVKPVRFPTIAYNTVYNEWYRDQTHITEVSVTQNTILKRAWEKDYFTAALPWQQRGTAPAFPISGTIDIEGVDEDITMTEDGDWPPTGAVNMQIGASGNLQLNTAVLSGDTRWDNTALQVDLGTATTFDVSDLRLAFQIQRWLERNARGGARYPEYLWNHYGEAPRDERLERPEYIGGFKAPIIISEVLQTSATGIGSETTPQGNLAGHGISVDRQAIGKYRVKEHGIIIGIMSIMPKPTYSSQGVSREWIKSSKYDYYVPEFANLSEQPIYEGELYCDGTQSHHETVFGYIGRYDEYRYSRSIVTGDMRSDFDEWHLARQFTSRPSLNQSFIDCDPDTRIFANESEDGFIVSCGNIIKAVRPMPIISNPGLIDH